MIVLPMVAAELFCCTKDSGDARSVPQDSTLSGQRHADVLSLHALCLAAWLLV